MVAVAMSKAVQKGMSEWSRVWFGRGRDERRNADRGQDSGESGG